MEFKSILVEFSVYTKQQCEIYADIKSSMYIVVMHANLIFSNGNCVL